MSVPSAEQLLAGLSPDQGRAVTSDAGLLCVVAGAGSGKTTVLTRRVAWRVRTGSARAEHVLVVTFTRKAATELRARLERLGIGGVWAATFHSAAFRILRRHWADQGRPALGLVADPERILRRLLEESGADQRLAPALAGEFSWARARLVDAHRYPQQARRARRSFPLAPEQVVTLMAGYEEHKRRRRVMDLDDLVAGATDLLDAGGAPAHAVRWRIQHLFVDEFQDVNPAQWRFLESLREGRPDLCVVGDPCQAIYAWNGSDPFLLGRLATLLPGTEMVALSDNHRSSPQVVRAAAAALGPAGSIDGAPSPAGASGPGAGALRPDGPPPTLRGFADESTEARAVARWLRTARRPVHPWRHLAVLARTNARLDPLASALSHAGIPHRRAAAGARSAHLGAVLRSLRAMAPTTPLYAALVDAGDEAGPEHSSGDGDDVSVRMANLADEHAVEEPRPTVGSFLTWMAATGAESDGAEGADAVVLATFHQAKGLEWRAVAVVGLEEGTMPIAYAADDAARAEERRLLYVALTRAEEQLWCSWASTSDAGAGDAENGGHGRRRPRGPSPFLVPLRAAIQGEQPPPATPVAVARVAELRQRLATA